MEQLIKSIDYIFNGKLKLLTRFSTTGVINTLIDFLVFTICNSVFNIYYTISQVIGYSFGVINSFIFNKKWTFEKNSSNKRISHELTQFIAVNLISLIITLFLIKYLVSYFNLNVYVAKIIVTLIAQVINFILYKFWVFN
ncbi:GtrA family protein [Clostridium fermenticellae]|uniref:GtrA family protein n=1 Tax=Clostridium fermenticellae TaxID=2068654 RepID=A0A386H476_9CLOT|nr:GtrA family protein [Clostridium fermenticellae]AYD40466.1 GtrA family protein [Clostridium fermenticellae]